MPKFDQLWVDGTQEESRLAARGRLHASQLEEIQALTAHAKKGKGKEGRTKAEKIKVKDQVQFQNKRRRRSFHKFNTSDIRSTTIMLDNVTEQRRESTMPQLLMLMKILLRKDQGMLIIQSSSLFPLFQIYCEGN